ncbi:MAG: helix-turn-helix domain-containing protein [Clostridia bacterium]|nr:helix-turn-helix domain-containing protein [Clostridia bacterium]
MKLDHLPNRPLNADMAYINGNWKYYTMDLHSHGFLECNYIAEGRCVYEIGGIPYQISKHNLILLDSTIPHKITFSHDQPCTVVGMSLSFQGGADGNGLPGLQELLGRSVEIRSLLLSLQDALIFPDARALKGDLLRMAREYDGRRDAFYLDSLACHLLAEVARLPRTETSSVQYYVEKTQAYIKEAFYLIRSNEQIAAHTGLNATYLERIYKKATGKTLWESVTDCRLAAAEELLACSDIPITEIDTMIGLANRQTFYLQFKKRYGMSPSEFRRERSAAGKRTEK